MASYKQAPNFTVIRDTREQEGYYFSEYGTCEGMVDQKLDTGDYSILGMEDKICIERKGCVEELAINLGQKKHTFLKEIDRMEDFPHKFIILEFNIADLIDFPENSRIPEKSKASVKITGKFMLKCLMEFQLYNDIHVIFCGNKYNAFLTVSSILKRVNEMHTVGRKK